MTIVTPGAAASSGSRPSRGPGPVLGHRRRHGPHRHRPRRHLPPEADRDQPAARRHRPHRRTSTTTMALMATERRPATTTRWRGSTCMATARRWAARCSTGAASPRSTSSGRPRRGRPAARSTPGRSPAHRRVVPPGLLNHCHDPGLQRGRGSARRPSAASGSAPDASRSSSTRSTCVRDWNRLLRPPRDAAVAVASCPFGRRGHPARRSSSAARTATCPSFLRCSSASGRATPDRCRSRCRAGRSPRHARSRSHGLGPLLDDLDELVVDAGGRVYLAKDSRMRPELLPLMYPRLDEWRGCGPRSTPTACCSRDLGRRLGLV